MKNSAHGVFQDLLRGWAERGSCPDVPLEGMAMLNADPWRAVDD